MGRQIRFYITQPDADALIELIRSKGGIFMSTSGEELTKDDLAQITNVEYIEEKYKDSCIYIKLPDSKMKFDYFSRIYVDSMRSDVIQFVLPHPVKNKKDTFAEGRFWYETSYYDKKGELIQNTMMKKCSMHLCDIYEKIIFRVTINLYILGEIVTKNINAENTLQRLTAEHC